MATTSVSIGQAVVTILDNDVATAGGQPLLSLLQSLLAAKGNLLMEAAAVTQFIAAAPAAGITLEQEVEQQLLTWAINKVQAYLASKAAAPTAGISAAAPAAAAA